MENIVKALEPIIRELNLQSQESDNAIKVIDPNNKYFEVSIKVNNDVARIYFKTNNEEGFRSKFQKYSDGLAHWISTRYDYNYLLRDDNLITEVCTDLNLPKNYETARDLLYHFSKNFKASKNPKLIYSDILPLVRNYKKIMDYIAPIIEHEKDRDSKVVNILNSFELYTKYKRQMYERNTGGTFYLNIGKLEISQTGTGTLFVDLTVDQITDLLKDQVLKLELKKQSVE